MTDQTSTIPKGWKMTTLGEVADKIGDGLHGTPKYSNNGEYYFINGNNIENGRIAIKPGTHKVDGEEFEKYKKDLGKNTILLSINGTIGNLAKYKDEKCILGKSAAYINIKNENNQDFVYYLMLDSRFQRDVSKNANGSTIKNVSLAQLRNYSFILPSSLEQRAIASVLSSLDDKIELLREQSKTLEATAQAIFKEWFVNFNLPRSTGKMIDSELGEIPEGWRLGKLENEFQIIMGQSPSGTSYNEDGNGMIFFQGRTDFKERYPTVRLYTTEPKRIAEKHDVLVSVRAPVGDINVAFEQCCIGRGLGAVRGKYKSYTLYKIQSLKDIFQNFESEGTVFGSINKNSFAGIDVIIPPIKIVERYDAVIYPLDQKIFNNYSQIQTLSSLRDALLSKLMKGKLRVKEFAN